MPPELQAAVDAGQKEVVEELLKSAPEGMSKTQMKKLLKNAEINLKKLEKQAAKGSKPAPQPSAKKIAAAADVAAAATAPPPVAPSGGVVSKAEAAIVELLLERMQRMGLSDAVSACRERQGDLSLAVAPALNALRNEAYTAGFNARLA